MYDGLNPVQEIVSGTPRANLLTGGLDEFFARTDSGGTSSFLTDALGSTLALADSTATVQTQYTFDPFGNTTSTGASSTNAFQYTGRKNDGSGMYYYRARYYSAGLQRFISEDPIGLSSGDTNFYAYAGSDPVDAEDPFGLIKSSHCDLFGGCSTDPWPKLGKRYSTDPNKGGMRTATYCSGKALEAKGLSIGLDVLGAFPGLGNVVSATAATARAVNNIATVGGGIAGVGMSLSDGTPYGAASAAAGLGLTLADASVGGTKAIPVIGNFISGSQGIYDIIYGAYKAYQQCMAGGSKTDGGVSMFDYDPPKKKKEPTDYTGLILAAILAPVLLLFIYLGKADMGLAAVIALGMIIFAVKIRWNLRKHVWFWATIVFILALHVPLVFIVRWPQGNVPIIFYSMPIGIADFLIILGAVGLAEKFFSKDSSSI